MLVIIPTAGIGSRLELQTKNFNKIMIQLGDLPVVSRIIDSYPTNTKFILILGYKKEHIREYINLVYPNKKIILLNVFPFEGPGSSLTHTLRSAISKINEPFFFHTNDSVFLDKDFYKDVKVDTMYLYKGASDTLKYATVEYKKKKKIIHSKLNYLDKNFFNYTGVGYIKDYKLFKKILLKKDSFNGEIDYFRSLRKVNFKFIKKWFDIGSKDTKEKAENYFSKKNILPKYDQGIYFKNNVVHKFFTDPSLVKKRIKRAIILKGFVPKIKNYSNFFYTYNYKKGSIVSNIKSKEEIFIKLLDWLQKKFWVKKNLNSKKNFIFLKKCHEFYYEKTYSRINLFYEKNNLSDSYDVINNVKTPKISHLINSINWKQMSMGIPVKFHGDLHLENILYQNNKFYLLDWREDFAGLTDYGDIYYDLAKINHGFIIDHNVIKKKKYNIKFINNNKMRFNYLQSNQNIICKEIFYNFLKRNNYSIKKVEILTALIYLNIAGLHHYPYSIFLYYLGKFELTKAINRK
jgi:dTDP-glucose pyrophosphorylase